MALGYFPEDECKKQAIFMSSFKIEVLDITPRNALTNGIVNHRITIFDVEGNSKIVRILRNPRKSRRIILYIHVYILTKQDDQPKLRSIN